MRLINPASRGPVVVAHPDGVQLTKTYPEAMKQSLTSLMLLVVRLVVGAEFVVKGVPKIMNTAGAERLAAGVHLPALFGWLPTIIEPLGGALLILGLATRWVSLYFMAEMVMTGIVSKLILRGLAFSLPGNQPGVGWELDSLIFACVFALAVMGPGMIALDRVVAALMRRDNPATAVQVAAA
ncbi:MAG: DoxX family membrane protein [Chloroflexi bacterium]|nr:DoxX family membrane protein [Chloroflexota bacterium]